MKKLIISITLFLFPILVNAETVEINGIWYNLFTKAKEAEVTKDPSGDNYSEGYSGVVIIPESVSHNGIDYSVTAIGDVAFYQCSNLTSLTIPKNVKRVKDHAFSGCSKLNSVYISDIAAWCNIVYELDSHYPLENGGHLFLNGEEVIDLVIPNNVTTINDGTFRGCSAIKSLSISNSVTNIGNSAFWGCSGLSSVTIPNSVKAIGKQAFVNCSGLTSIIIPNSVTSIGDYVFFGCTGLTSVTIPNCVTSIGESAFEGCTGLTSIDIPNSVTYIGQCAFNTCTSLTSINIPNSVTTIDGGAFSICSKVTTVTLGESVKNISHSFYGCQELTDVYCLAESVPVSSVDAFNGSHIEDATLHVPASAINTYKTTAPWSEFGNFVTIEEGDTPETKKCAKPTIIFENGKIKFNCETEGVEYISEITTADTKKYYDGEVTPTFKYNVSVYAVKDGYENSDSATAEITASGKFGDMNHDNKITVADAVIIIDKVMKNEE